MFVKGEPSLDFQYVAKAIDIAHGAGIDKVGLMTAKVEAGQGAKMRKFILILGVASMALLASSCQKLRSRDQLNKGVAGFQERAVCGRCRKLQNGCRARSELSDGPPLFSHRVHAAVHPGRRIA